MAIIKKKQIASVGEDVDKKRSWYSEITIMKIVWKFLKNLKSIPNVVAHTWNEISVPQKL